MSRDRTIFDTGRFLALTPYDRSNTSDMGNQVQTTDVMAGIVTFNPDLERLAQNLDAIACQVGRAVIFDNGSENADELGELVGRWDNVELISGESNFGIAHALNQLLDVAEGAAASYLLTLDQDSVASGGMVSALKSFMSARVGMVTPLIVDRNKQELAAQDASLPPVQTYKRAARRGAITSGALLSVAAAREAGNFDERLFIDYVDYDLNARLLLAGYEILRVNSVTLLHEVGSARPTWLFTFRRTIDGAWRIERFYSFGHSEQRCYFKARNRVVFSRKYGLRFGLTNEGIWQIPQQIVLTLLFEEQKREKLLAFARGVRDGFRLQLGPEPKRCSTHRSDPAERLL